MQIISNLRSLLTFRGNLNPQQAFFCIFFIELLRVVLLQTFTSLSLPKCNLAIFLTYFPLMAMVLYLYGITIAARLRNLHLNPNYAYLWVLGIWFSRYILLPAAQTTHDMFHVISVSFVFIFLMLPLFVKDTFFAEYIKK